MQTAIAHRRTPAAGINPLGLKGHAAGPANLITQLPRLMAWSALLLGMSLLGLRLAGYELIYLRGNSMEPTLSAGSLLLASPTAPQDVQIGDVVVFPSGVEGFSHIVHRVVTLQANGRKIVARTMGDNNPVLDPEPLILERALPRVVLAMPYIGWWMTPTLGWYFLGIGVMVGLMVAFQVGAQCKRRDGTNGLRPMGPASGVDHGGVSVFLDTPSTPLTRPLYGRRPAEGAR